MGEWTLNNMGVVTHFTTDDEGRSTMTDWDTYEVEFDIASEHLSGTARYVVNASDEERAIAVAKRRAIADHIPVLAATRIEARVTDHE